MAGCATCLHKNVHPNVCSDCLGGTHFKPRIKTNADRIRAMTDEELATKLYLSTCIHVFDSEVKCKDNGCKKCWLDWLRQEAEA